MMRSRVLYGFVLALAVLFLLSYDGTAAYIFLYGVLTIPVFSFVSVNTARFFIKLQQSFEKHYVFKNETLSCSIDISNKGVFSHPVSRFIFHSEIYADYKRDMGLSVDATTTYSVSFKYRGVYPVGVRTVMLTDLLGLFSVKYTLGDINRITVYPGMDEFLILPLRGELLNKATSNFDMYQDNYADVTDVRKYEPSDDYRKIHWKLTAKKNEFMVKNYQATAMNKTIVFLESNATGMKGINATAFEDELTAKAASVVYFCAKSRMPAELLYGDGYTDRLYISGLEEMNGLYYLLANLQFSGKEDIAKGLEKSMNEEEGFFNIVLVIFHMDFKLFEMIRNLQVFGHNFIIYYFTAGSYVGDVETDSLLQDLTQQGAEVIKETVIRVSDRGRVSNE